MEWLFCQYLLFVEISPNLRKAECSTIASFYLRMSTVVWEKVAERVDTIASCTRLPRSIANACLDRFDSSSDASGIARKGAPGCFASLGHEQAECGSAIQHEHVRRESNASNCSRRRGVQHSRANAVNDGGKFPRPAYAFRRSLVSVGKWHDGDGCHRQRDCECENQATARHHHHHRCD